MSPPSFALGGRTMKSFCNTFVAQSEGGDIDVRINREEGREGGEKEGWGVRINIVNCTHSVLSNY